MKKPPTKKEKPLLAAPLAYGRLRRPPLSLLFSLPSAAAPPPFLALSALLSPLVGGCAAPPLCFSSRASFGRLRRPTPSASLPLLLASSAAAPPHSPPRSRGRLAPPPRPLLFPLYQTINKPLTPSHVMNLSVLHLTSLPLVTLKGRYRKPLAFFIFCHNCLNV